MVMAAIYCQVAFLNYLPCLDVSRCNVMAVAATGMKTTDEPRLFRKVIGHSLLLVALVAVLNVIYSALTKA